jgi:hypothetical protein
MRVEDFPLRLHTAQEASFWRKLGNPAGKEYGSYSTPYNTSLANENGLPLSGSFGKQR